MLQYLAKSVMLLFFLVVIVCGIYPLVLWCIGQTIFPFQAHGSLILDASGKLIGSKLIAQPFTQDEYFHPRPSAAAYDATASTSSALAASNYALRDRVARMLGPIVKYSNGQAVAPDIEKWFQQDMFQEKPHIVAQWATLHHALAKAWVTADPTHAAFVDHWMKMKTHAALVAQYIKENPNNPMPQAFDLAIVFFQNFATENPGKFPAVVVNSNNNSNKNNISTHGNIEYVMQAVNTGSDIQSIFFDLWRQDHPDAQLQNVPGDMVTTSGSGLDPHITLQNAYLQLDRVAHAWARRLKRDTDAIAEEIHAILQKNAEAPLGGLAGEKIINVLVVNLELNKRYA